MLRFHARRLQEVIRLTRKRIQASDPNHAYLGLVLTESLCKNCGMRLVQALAHDTKFLAQMQRIAERFESSRSQAEIRTY